MRNEIRAKQLPFADMGLISQIVTKAVNFHHPFPKKRKSPFQCFTDVNRLVQHVDNRLQYTLYHIIKDVRISLQCGRHTQDLSLALAWKRDACSLIIRLDKTGGINHRGSDTHHILGGYSLDVQLDVLFDEPRTDRSA
jgi:hypothetical protein